MQQEPPQLAGWLGRVCLAVWYGRMRSRGHAPDRVLVKQSTTHGLWRGSGCLHQEQRASPISKVAQQASVLWAERTSGEAPQE